MPTPDYTGMDRATWSYLLKRQSEEWHGFAVKTKNTDQSKKIQEELSKILKRHGHEIALNGETLDGLTDRAYPEIIYCAGEYDENTVQDIRAYLKSQKNISVKTRKDGYEQFVSPVWVKESFGLPPSSYVSQRLSKYLH